MNKSIYQIKWTSLSINRTQPKLIWYFLFFIFFIFVVLSPLLLLTYVHGSGIGLTSYLLLSSVFWLFLLYLSTKVFFINSNKSNWKHELFHEHPYRLTVQFYVYRILWPCLGKKKSKVKDQINACAHFFNGNNPIIEWKWKSTNQMAKGVLCEEYVYFS